MTFWPFFVKIVKCHVERGVYKVFYDEQKAIAECDETPSTIFLILKEGHIDLVEKILSKKKIDLNIIDEGGDNILMKLLKKGHVKLVLNYIKDKNWNVNHQNNEGDTFAHILVSFSNPLVIDVLKVIQKNPEFIPNIKNNRGETILDKSLAIGYASATFNILEDERFSEIGVLSFMNLYKRFIKTKEYGKYTKMTTIEIIIDSLEDKEVSPKIKDIIYYLKSNFDEIKKDVFSNKTKKLDKYVLNVLSA